MRDGRRWRGWAVVVAVAAGAGAVAGWLAGLGGEEPQATVPAECPALPTGALADVVAEVRRSTVGVQAAWTVFDPSGAPVFGRMVGAGFVFDADGLVATSAHLVEQGGAVTVTLPDGDEVDGRVVGVDEEHDVALLDTGVAGLRVPALGCSSELRVGEEVAAIGSALGFDGDPTVSAGIVAALHRDLATDSGRRYHDLVQLDIALNQGHSGGPVIDAEGHVVGMTAAADAGGTGVGFAVGIDEALPVLEHLAASER